MDSNAGTITTGEASIEDVGSELFRLAEQPSRRIESAALRGSVYGHDTT